DTAEIIVVNIIDWLFKLVEITLFVRLMLTAFSVSTTNNELFAILRNIGGIPYSIFSGVIGNVSFGDIVIEVSTFLFLVFVIVIDVSINAVLRSVLDDRGYIPPG